MQPLIIDLDDSVKTLPGEQRLDFRGHCDRLRFACSVAQLQDFGTLVDAMSRPHPQPQAVFMGSGDFHHLSLPLIARAAARGGAPLRVIVFDNHPDNMRFPFGVHCGSWVARAAALRGVVIVDVIGITSSDIGWAHAWENRISPLRNGRLRYWSTGVSTRWASSFGLEHAFRGFESIDAMMAALLLDLRASRSPVYLSIDKDVLDPADARTNWDQGLMRMDSLLAAIAAVKQRLAGFDVCGEVSQARYTQPWKRWLSALDGQPDIDPGTLSAWQTQHHSINLRLLRALAPADPG